MASIRQIAANRANAQKSTGPRTPEGRAASSTNALKSGIYAKSTLIPGEDPAEFEAFRAELYDQFAPANPDERDLLDLTIKYKWQLRRLHESYDQMWLHYTGSILAAENRHENSILASTFIRANLQSPNLINLSRVLHSTDRAFHRTRAALIHTQEKRQRAELGRDRATVRTERGNAAQAQPAPPQPTAPDPIPAPDPQPAAVLQQIGFVPVKTPLSREAAAPITQIHPRSIRSDSAPFK